MEFKVTYVRGCEIEGMIGQDGQVIEEFGEQVLLRGFFLTKIRLRKQVCLHENHVEA